MTEETILIRDLAVILAASGLVTAVFHRLRQPVVLGYLLVGMVIGPHTQPFALISDRHSMATLAELGVIFLLFSLGLEFNLRKLRRVGGVAVVAALVEIPAMLWLGYAVARLLGWNTMDSVFLGAVLSISSTTIIVKALAEFASLRTESARIIMGILIVQDLAVIVMLVLLSGLASAGTVNASDILMALLRVAVFVTSVVVIGLLTVPRLLHYLASFEVREVLTVTVLGLCLGIAVLAGTFGFSVALGAFLMGAVMAESRSAHDIELRIEPIRDMFSAVFFVAVGSIIDPSMLIEHWAVVLVVSVVAIAGKLVTCALATVLAGYRPEVATRVGMGLAPIGEFSFVIVNLGLATKVVSPLLYPVTVGVAAVTTLFTPYLIRVAGPLGALVERHAPRIVRSYVDFHQDQRRRRHARRTAPFWGDLRPPVLRSLAYVTLLAATVIGAARATALLDSRGTEAGLSTSDLQVLVWTVWGLVSLPIVTGIARSASELATVIADGTVRPEGRVFVRETLRFVFAIGGGACFLALGSPVLPGGLPLAITLVLVGISGAVFWRTVAGVRERAERALRAVLAADPDEPPAGATARRAIARLAADRYPFQVLLEEVVLPIKESAANRSIKELQIRTRTGATVAAIVRDTESITNPAPSVQLEPGDVLVIMGSREQVTRAIRYFRTLAEQPADRPPQD